MRVFSEELRREYSVDARFVTFDFSKRDAPEELFEWLDSNKLVKRIQILVNCAGFGVTRRFIATDGAVLEDMVTVNSLTYMKLARLLVPSMVARQEGRVMFVNSLASYSPTPLEAVYGATKAFGHNFGLALRNELSGTGVMVTNVMPGITTTGFFASSGCSKCVD